MSVKIAGFLAATALLAGCAQSKPPKWYLNGKSQTHLDSAYAYCTNQADQIVDNEDGENAGYAVGAGLGGRDSGSLLAGIGSMMLMAAKAEKIRDQCMAQRGFPRAPN